MPGNEDFSFKVLIGNVQVPEYEKQGSYYIESNLSTPVSYLVRQADTVNGEAEAQMVPVTPYQLLVTTTVSAPPCYYKILVDGVKVKGLGLEPGVSKRIKGFRDNNVLREFLFSLPRFGNDQEDRVDPEQLLKIGTIEIQCWNSYIKQTIKRSVRRGDLDFKQATKKDSVNVTNGNYTMATSKVGKVIGPRSFIRKLDYWKLVSLRSSISVRYHMGHTLQEMGFTLLPVNIPPTFTTNPSLRSNGNTRQHMNDQKDSGCTLSVKTDSESNNCIVVIDSDGEDDCSVVDKTSTVTKLKDTSVKTEDKVIKDKDIAT